MLQRLNPDPEVCKILSKFIVDTKMSWSKQDGGLQKMSMDEWQNFKSIGEYDIVRAENCINLQHETMARKKLQPVADMIGASYLTNYNYYPKSNYLTWHTNSDVQGTRTYYSFCSGGYSCFRYIDPETKEVIDVVDKKGWNVNQFIVSKEKPLWHTVYSDTRRFSFGFNTEKHI